MVTVHKIINANSKCMPIEDTSVDLIVTSPPYPMVSMWDKLFCSLDNSIESLFERDSYAAYEKMHNVLDSIWSECNRVLKDGGLICINIGDATRTIADKFVLYPNHCRIMQYFVNNGFKALPLIIWQKVSNAPNKFMGSGMLPTGAYITQEHEYILIFRKGGLRKYVTEEEKGRRRESAYFFEERNEWFSDCWKIKGTKQTKAKGIRECSAAYPFEIPYRLINMFSIKGDVVLDPFNGTGTTMLASMLCERNSIGVEIESALNDVVKQRTKSELDVFNQRVWDRYGNHFDYISKMDTGIDNVYHDWEVKTLQEKGILLNLIDSIEWNDNEAVVKYTKCFG